MTEYGKDNLPNCVELPLVEVRKMYPNPATKIDSVVRPLSPQTDRPTPRVIGIRTTLDHVDRLFSEASPHLKALDDSDESEKVRAEWDSLLRHHLIKKAPHW